MSRINLTTGRIRAFETDEGQAFLWDSETPGLGVRVTAPGKRSPTGNKAFIFQANMPNGQSIRITIGDTAVWSIDAARVEARTLKKLIDQGLDPRQEKKARIAESEALRKQAQHADAPASDAWAVYVESRQSKWGVRSYQDHLRYADPGGKPKTRGRKKGEGDKTEPGALYALLTLPLREITATRVSEWVKSEAMLRPTNTALAFRLLRAFLNWCLAHPDYQDLVSADACRARSVRDELPKRASKDDCLQREQLQLWFKFIRKLPNPVHAAYLQALLITGARREELAWLKWEDVDFQWNTLTIRDKVEGERLIPLTPYVATLLAGLPKRKMIVDGNEVRNPWVFSSPTAQSGRLQEPRISHNKALTAAGLPPLSLHGLRRSFGTLAEWVEVPTGIVAQIMGHKPSAIAEKHYRRRPVDLLRLWHSKIEAWILEQADIHLATAAVPPPAIKLVTSA